MRAYDLLEPAVPSGSVIFASPHSGRHYPPEFVGESVLSAHDLRSSEDAFVDQLVGAAPAHGAPLLCARWPRAWIDLNRAASELDPALIAGLARRPHNSRVASGLGVVPRVVAGGRAIYRGKITQEAARARIRDVWQPYHDRLRALMEDARARFGEAILIDVHSMPHEALEGVAGRRPDVVLGDRYGAAAAPRIIDGIEAILNDLGLHCARNTPFAGAYTAQRYGHPARGWHVIQVEIDRALYMDEAAVAPHEGFAAMRARMDEAVAGIVALGRPEARPLAAE